MTKRQRIYDVFLSHNRRDKGLARFVIESLSETGLTVFTETSVKPGEPIGERLREELAGSSAVVVLLTPAMLESANLAFEVGMAMAWAKPIYIVYDGIAKGDIPEFVSQFQLYPVREIAKVGKLILQSKAPLGDKERDELAALYADFSVSTDELLVQPAALHELTRQYNERTASHLGASRVIQELIRLRKQGKLPQLHERATSA